MPAKQSMVTFNRPKLVQLKAAYVQAVEQGATAEGTFRFEGNEYVISYVKYLIEYLEGTLDQREREL